MNEIWIVYGFKIVINQNNLYNINLTDVFFLASWFIIDLILIYY